MMFGIWHVVRRWRGAVAAGLVFFVAAEIGKLVAAWAGGGVAFWPANALILGLIFARKRPVAEMLGYVGGGVVASFGYCLMRQAPLIADLLFPLANGIEILLAWLVITRLGGIEGSFERVRDVLALVAACLIAPSLSGLLGAIAIHASIGTDVPSQWAAWYVAAALGMAVVTPMVVIGIRLAQRIRGGVVTVQQAAEAALLLALAAVVAVLIFIISTLPLLFVIVSIAVLATFRLRQVGAVASAGIVALAGTWATVAGFGPVAHSGLDHAQQLLFLQFFVAVLFVTALPVAATLAERDRRTKEVHMLADHFRAVVENVVEVIFRTDRRGCWTYLNPAWETVSGYRIEDSIGRSVLDCVDGSARDELAEWMQPMFAGQVRSSRRMVRFRTAQGSVRWMEYSVQLLCDAEGRSIGTTGTLRDIDDRKKLEEHVLSAKRRAEERAREATVLASTDELTGLANRRAFLRHLDGHIDAANEIGWNVALAIFDVDHFKLVNDSRGHAVGDRVLQRVAQRALSQVRSGDLVGRLGGEEFGILMPGASADDAVTVAERVRQAIENPDDGEEPLPQVTVSVGVASFVTGYGVAQLLSDADAALYRAKGDGRNRVRVAA